TMRDLGSSDEPEWKSKSFRYTANFLAEMGKVDEAMAVLAQGVSYDHGQGRLSDEAEKLLGIAYLQWRRGDFENARRKALEAAEASQNPVHLAEAGSLLARSGFIAQAHSQLDQLKSYPSNQRIVFATSRLTGEVELAEGKTVDALQHLRDAAARARPRE